MVVATGGGAVGVTVSVSICPVTVMTDMYGVGVHVVLDDGLGVDVGNVDEGVFETIGVTVGRGVVVECVDGGGGLNTNVEVGMIKGVGVMLELVDVVEGV